MFLGFILIVALGLTFVQLGSYSVWVTIFSAALKVAAVIIAGLVALLVWTKLIKKGKSIFSKNDVIDVTVETES